MSKSLKIAEERAAESAPGFPSAKQNRTNDPQAALMESGRVRRLHEGLAAAVPCDPEEIRSDLLAMPLCTLIHTYLNWADRFVRPTPRKVQTSDGFFQQRRTGAYLDVIAALTAKIEAGADLKPFLSDKIASCGYIRPRLGKNNRPRGVEWRDKDYALNAHEAHHLHLDIRMKSNGWSERTKELLYVTFSRDDALLLMVGDHNSFDDGTLARAIAEARVGTAYEIKGILGTSEEHSDRERNQLQRHGISTLSAKVGDSYVMGAMLSTAGTNSFMSIHGNRWMLAIKDYDGKLDQPGFGRDWFERAGRPYPKAPQWEWAAQYSDLFVVEASTKTGFPIVQWRR